MEMFPGNLDDGKSWLPSDIFPPEDAHHHNRLTAVGGNSMENLSHQISHLKFLDHHPYTTPKVSSNYQVGVYGGMSQYALTTTLTNGCHGLTVGPNGVDHGQSNYRSGPVYQIPDIHALHFPVQKPVVEQWETKRAKSNSRHVHRQQQSCLSPLRATECNSKSSSTSSGTGVFIPRTTFINGGYKNKAGVTAQRRAARKFGTMKPGDYHCYHTQLPSEMGLPKDWTY